MTGPRPAPFEVVRPLGEGGMGAVFEVRVPGRTGTLAAKLLRTLSGSYLARFSREAELLGRLRHPHIITIEGAGQLPDGSPYLLMELVAGRSLADEQDSYPLPVERAARLGRQVAEALGCAHKAGIVHRDVKPHNILVDEAGQARLADFGLALAADQERLTRTGQLLGTPQYMAREQVGEGGEVGPWTDVHALGAVLYHLLSGQLPFAGSAVPTILYQVATERPTPLRELRPEVPPALAAIVERCLEKEPEARYPDGDALAADLRAFLGGSAVSAVSGQLRRRVRGALVGLLFLTAALLLGAWAAGLARARAATREAQELTTMLVSTRGALSRAREPGDRAEALARAAAALDQAGAGLLRAEALAEASALEALRSAVQELTEAHERERAAVLVEELQGGPQSLPGPIEAAGLRFDGLPPRPEARDHQRLELRRAWVLLATGRAAEAARALGELPLEGDAWSEAGRGTLVVWALARLRRWDEARAAAGAGPPLLQARLALVEAELGGGPDTAAEGVIGRAPLGTEREHLRLRLRLLRLRGREGSGAALVELLEEVRARTRALETVVPAPPGSARAEGELALLEGEIGLALGWPASAALAFSRAVMRLPAGPVPSTLAPSPPSRSGASLVGLAQAARLGEARARLELLDEPAARAACALAEAWSRLDPAPPPAARQDDPAWYLALASAELAVAEAASDPSLQAAPAARATRALDLARSGLEPALEARAILLTSRLALLRGDVEGARRAAEQALVRAPQAWEVHLTRALARAPVGPAEAVEADARVALELALREDGRRQLERVDAALTVVVRAAAALREDPRGAALLEEGSLLADAEGLSPVRRAGWHEALRAAAERWGDAPQQARAAERLQRAQQDRKALGALERRAFDPELDAVGRRTGSGDAVLALLRAAPSDSETYRAHISALGQAMEGGLDAQVIAAELRSPERMADLRSLARTYPGGGELETAFLRGLLDPRKVNADLPQRRDDDLHQALGTLYVGHCGLKLTRAERLAGLEAARRLFRRRPGLRVASVMLGLLRTDLGDVEGGELDLARARSLPDGLGLLPR